MNRYRFVLSAALFAFVAMALAPVVSARPSRDPFKRLIEKKRQVAPEAPQPPKVIGPPVKRFVPPPKIEILAFLAETGSQKQSALISYRGAEYLVARGWQGDGEPGFDNRFTVKSVDEEGINFYDTKTKKLGKVRYDDDAGSIELVPAG